MQNMNSEMKNVCRVCLDKPGRISIFNVEEGIQNSVKIMSCVDVIIAEGDGYPETICADCIKDLNISYLFIKRCLESDKKMRRLTTPKKEEDSIEIKKEENIDEFSEFDSTIDEYLIEDLVKSEIKEEESGCKSEAVCVVCGYKAVCKSALDRHVVKHKQSSNKTYSINATLQHQEARHCQVLKNNKKKKLVVKQSQKKKDYPMQCSKCEIMVTSRSAMENHMRTHTGERPFQCDHCAATFVTKGGLKKHLLVHTKQREKKFICDMCGSSFYRKSQIISHLRIHTNDRPYRCKVCPRAFSQLSSYIRHNRMHTGEKPYSCLTCHKKFILKSEVTKHQLVHSEEKKFSCKLCNKFLKSRNALNIHMNIHSNEKQYVCSYCGEQFSFTGNLMMHIKRMHSERSGQCTVCHKEWPNLDEHMRQHTGEKPYVCKICDQAFICQRSLSYHISFKHKNAEKFKCTVNKCTKSFPNSGLLEWHILKEHSVQRPYTCKHCERGFFRVCDLTRHMKGTHNDVSKIHIEKQLSKPLIDTI